MASNIPALWDVNPLVWQMFSDISEEHAACVCRVEEKSSCVFYYEDKGSTFL
jgi:hypothetical protein